MAIDPYSSSLASQLAQANTIRQNRVSERPAREDISQRPQPQPNQSPRPQRAAENYVPANESIATLVRSALQSQKQGALWDRGSILNIVV